MHGNSPHSWNRCLGVCLNGLVGIGGIDHSYPPTTLL